MADYDDDFPELESFDDGFRIEPRKDTIRPGLDSLPDGYYEFLILDAARKRAQGKSQAALVAIGLRVVGGAFDGRTVQWDRWLTSEEGVRILGTDLFQLGLDADKWNKAEGRPFSAELRQQLPRLVGVKFTGKKVTKDGQYANLWIQGLSTPPRPAPAAAAPKVGTAAVGQASHPLYGGGPLPAQTSAPPAEDEDIPF